MNLNLRVENVKPGLDLHLLVENLFDNPYYQFGEQDEIGPAGRARTPQPTLRFLLGATWRWMGPPPQPRS